MNIVAEKAYSIQEIIENKLIPGVNIYSNVYNLCTEVVNEDFEKIFITSGRIKSMSQKRVIRKDDGRLVAHSTDPNRANSKIVVYGKDIENFLKKPYKAGVKYYYKGVEYTKAEMRNIMKELSPEQLVDFDYLLTNKLI